MDCFDPESGLVFRETIVRSRRRHEREPDWEHKCANLRASAAPRWFVESLYDKALRKVIENASILSPEILQAIPPILVTQIWEAIRNDNRESLHIWKIFVESGCGDECFPHKTSLSQGSFREPLVDYFLKVSSTSMAWMTHLDLFDIYSSAAELKQLKTVVNIRKLRICHRTKGHRAAIDDKVLDHWALCARDRTAFQFLETILVLGAPGISSYSFRLFDDFPALSTIRFYDTAVKRKHSKCAAQYGWSTRVDSELLDAVKARQAEMGFHNSDGKSNPEIYEYLDRPSSCYSWDFTGCDSLHILSVKFSGCSRLSWQSNEVENVLCFERKPNWKISAAKDKHPLPMTVSEEGAPNKKRKIRDGKAVQLNQLFDNF